MEKAAGKATNDIIFSNIVKYVGNFDNPWLIFFKYVEVVDKKCVQYMLPKWDKRPGGVHFVQALLQNSTLLSE